jgi:peptidoglycan/LPS O-acetylase OafA/YrhL
MKFRPEIQGLRALAVIVVILYHFGFNKIISGGFFGVDVFFVISGYLITLTIIEDIARENFSLTNFYERRARRLLPALFFLMLFCIPVAWVLFLPSDMKEFSDSIIATLLFISNILFWQTTLYFDANQQIKPLLHTWSLAIEEQFYIIFPIFLTLIWKFGHRVILIIFSVLVIIGLMLSQLLSLDKPAATFYLLPTRGWELIIGALTALYSLKNPSHLINKEAGALLGCAFLLYAVFLLDSNAQHPGLVTLLPTLGVALIIIFSNELTWVGKCLSNRFLVFIGAISYSAYLWHQPLLSFYRYKNEGEPSKAVFIGLIGFTFTVSYLSWKFIEKPFIKNQNLFGINFFKYLIYIGFFLLVFGLIGNYTSGFSFRYHENDKYLATLIKEEEGRYTLKRFNKLIYKPFDDADGRKKVLIIGDSFAQDLVNAIYETEFINNIQISAKQIPSGCGNLFIDYQEFSNNIEENISFMCKGKGIFEDKNLKKLMLSSDEIWLASNWQYWQIEYINRSVLNIQQYSNKHIKVFGPKNFGKVDIKELLSVDYKNRINIKGLIDKDVILINNSMRKMIKEESFVDSLELFCGSNASNCPVFVQPDQLITYDGLHLTKYGAMFFGREMLNQPRFQAMLKIE